jgi:TetR/AcrR family transcriptional regulator, cholesterol catabolism regulator
MRLGSGLETREGILEAAVVLFARQGYDATSLRDVADQAGTTKGTVYHYFKRKPDLLVAIHGRFVERELATLQAIVEESNSPSVQLSRIIEELAANHDTHRDEVAVFNRERRHMVEPEFESVRTQRAQVQQIIDEVISRGIEIGEFKPLPSSRLATFAVFGMTSWLSQWYAPTGKMSARDIGRTHADMLLHGMRNSTNRPVHQRPMPHAMLAQSHHPRPVKTHRKATRALGPPSRHSQ